MAYNLLKGKKGIIFGALNESSIGWKVAERAYEEGAEIILTNAPFALRMGEIDKLAKKLNSIVVSCDVTSLDDIEKLIKKSMEHFGGKFDFLLHSIGMSPNVRKDIPYDNINYANFLKTLDVSALSLHKILQTCRNYDAINEWGSVVALSYIAAQRTLDLYNDMADAKAILESIARSFGYIYGREKFIRINTISQSPTRTTAGSRIDAFDSLFDFTDRMSPLGNASANECADYCVTLFSDLTKKVTMQNLFHDGGFSSMGMSQNAKRQYEKSFEEPTEKSEK
ncbi:MAG: SDR family oxidoreductase [Ignavibacteriae bacterium]|nr:SDR family oxidoreductase [Ignavibacteriota bacterium]MCB9247811.1 SDR family oxidoreductase [Ignavibacteriales bacterium]